MKKKPVYTWYIQPLNVQANETVARELGGDVERGVLCEDGIKRTLWRCEYQFAAYLLQNAMDLHILVKVFSRRGGGAVRPWLFTKSRRAAAVMARRKLDAMRSRKEAS
ncbi:MAG: hypothetical protein AAB367_00465 [Patescibacteria group bacterium]